jgi:dihydrofolate synthase/folylpolyglutamate synthase
MSDKCSMPSEAIETYRDALRAIWLRSAYDRGFISNPFWGDDAADLGLRRTEALLKDLLNPHLAYEVIHVAGSKGKGSTCAFAASIGSTAGYETGLYTSPHLHSFRERISIDGNAISEDGFAQLTRQVLSVAERLEKRHPDLGEVTAFELVTVMAFAHFASEGCELAVIEVGLGGTLDATNVVSPVVSVITALDYEHTRVLGKTLTEIAANKAGIIKPHRPVIALAQEPAALQVIENAAHEKKSQLLLAGRDWEATGNWRDFTVRGPRGTFDHLQVNLPGNHQVQNAGAAVTAMRLLNQTGHEIPETAVRDGLASAVWPGRFEVITKLGQPKFILDGAHTPASARALVDAVLLEDASESRAIVLGMMSDKDPGDFARELAELSAPVIVTTSKSPRAASIQSVLAGVEAAGLQATPTSDVQSGLSAASQVAGVKGTVIVTGSLATVAEAREALGLAVPDPPVDVAAFAQSRMDTNPKSR